MAKLIFEGWEVGMRKIPFTKLLHEKAGLSLTEAKDIKDRLVDKGETIEITVDDEALANEILIKDALSMKVIARIE